MSEQKHIIIKQKHLGSECLPGYISDMADYIKSKGVTLHTSEEVKDIIVENGRVKGVVTSRKKYLSNNLILAPGRVGAEWVGKLAQKYGIGLKQRGIEVGVRVEVHKDIMQDLCDVIYDPTFFIQTSKYDDQTRTFCTNKGISKSVAIPKSDSPQTLKMMTTICAYFHRQYKAVRVNIANKLAPISPAANRKICAFGKIEYAVVKPGISSDMDMYLNK